MGHFQNFSKVCQPRVLSVLGADGWRSFGWKSPAVVPCSPRRAELACRTSWALWGLSPCPAPHKQALLAPLHRRLKGRLSFEEQIWGNITSGVWNGCILLRMPIPALGVNKENPLFVYKNIATAVYDQQALTEIGIACYIARLIYYYCSLRTSFVELVKINI